jgi:hypothetical protein
MYTFYILYAGSSGNQVRKNLKRGNFLILIILILRALFSSFPRGRPPKSKKTDTCFVCEKNKTDKHDIAGNSNFKGLIIKCNRSATQMKEINDEAKKFYEIPQGKKCCSRCRILLTKFMKKSEQQSNENNQIAGPQYEQEQRENIFNGNQNLKYKFFIFLFYISVLFLFKVIFLTNLNPAKKIVQYISCI